MQTRVETGKKPKTWKRMVVMIVAVLLLIVVIGGIKAMQIMKMMAGFGAPPPSVVSTAKATTEEWQPELRAVGSLRAARAEPTSFCSFGLFRARRCGRISSAEASGCSNMSPITR
jgi:membrane fusion protein (multidrug efflux system)